MAADDLVLEAIEELYSLDPDEFTERRTALAAQARTTGGAAAGKDIAALRKPTRSAYALNQLVRSDPDAAARLAELGDELRSAQESLDGAQMRELSTLRRGMVEELADQAFQVSRQRSPAPGLREEVVSTLNAAVADDSVVEQLRSGTLVRPARWDGFGFASPPELSVVRPSTAGQRRKEPASGRPATRSRSETARTGSAAGARSGAGVGTVIRGRGGRTGTAKAPTKAELRAQEAAARAEEKAEAKAEEQRRRQVRADAERAVKDSGSALAKAAKSEEEQQTRVRILHERLTDARHRLDEVRIDLRRAENRQRKAQQALDRLPN